MMGKFALAVGARLAAEAPEGSQIPDLLERLPPPDRVHRHHPQCNQHLQRIRHSRP